MEVKRSDIIARVKSCMEELTPEWTGAMERTEGVSIDRYIDGVIEEQLRLLFMTAPMKLLTPVEMKSAVVPAVRSDGTGRIILDATVLRPLLLKMEGWSVPVTRFIDENHPLYELQFNRYTRGGTSRPVAIWIKGVGDESYIDYFSLSKLLAIHTIESLLCVLHPAVGAESYAMHPFIYDDLCYRCAAAVYDIMGNHPMAEVMMSHTKV